MPINYDNGKKKTKHNNIHDTNANPQNDVYKSFCFGSSFFFVVWFRFVFHCIEYEYEYRKWFCENTKKGKSTNNYQAKIQ